MLKRITLPVCFFTVPLPLFAGISSDKAMYVGGTVSRLKQVARRQAQFAFLRGS